MIAISGSGNSPNLRKAIQYANDHGGITIGIIGYTDGKILDEVQHCVRLNINNMQIAEDLHVTVNHVLVNLLIESLENNVMPLNNYWAATPVGAGK